MSIFGKMFDKKVCDICGGDIGLLGNRKLSDGNLCKDCAKKLSPWMTDRRQSSVEEIRQHLAYREQNKERLSSFNPTVTYGHGTKVYVDQLQDIYFKINDLISEENLRDEESGAKMQAALQKIVKGWRP